MQIVFKGIIKICYQTCLSATFCHKLEQFGEASEYFCRLSSAQEALNQGLRSRKNWLDWFMGRLRTRNSLVMTIPLLTTCQALELI